MKTPLQEAIETNDVQEVKRLLKFCDINKLIIVNTRSLGAKYKGSWITNELEDAEYDVETYLSLAVKNKNIEIVQLLLNAGASPSIDLSSDYHYTNPLDICWDSLKQTHVQKQDSEKNHAIIKLLISHGANVSKIAIFDYAFDKKDYELVGILLEKGCLNIPEARYPELCKLDLRHIALKGDYEHARGYGYTAELKKVLIKVGVDLKDAIFSLEDLATVFQSNGPYPDINIFKIFINKKLATTTFLTRVKDFKDILAEKNTELTKPYLESLEQMIQVKEETDRKWQKEKRSLEEIIRRQQEEIERKRREEKQRQEKITFYFSKKHKPDEDEVEKKSIKKQYKP